MIPESVVALASGDVFDGFLDSHMNTVSLTAITMRAIRQVPENIPMLEAISNYHVTQGFLDDPTVLENAKRDALFAEVEIEKGFPFLLSQSTVLIWSRLEAYVEDVLATCIEHDAKLLGGDAVQRVKLSLARFQAMSASERRYHLIDMLQHDSRDDLADAEPNFERTLHAFGFGGAAQPDVKRSIWELAHVRNVLVHRRGRADRRLVSACPWLSFEIGDQVSVSYPDFARYGDAVIRYAADVFRRVLLHYGESTGRIDRLLQALPSPV